MKWRWNSLIDLKRFVFFKMKNLRRKEFCFDLDSNSSGLINSTSINAGEKKKLFSLHFSVPNEQTNWIKFVLQLFLRHHHWTTIDLHLTVSECVIDISSLFLFIRMKSSSRREIRFSLVDRERSSFVSFHSIFSRLSFVREKEIQTFFKGSFNSIQSTFN